jgi:tetratricopeptide (TPR) repeat protein
MMRRHPADYFPVGVAAFALERQGEGQAIRYANRSLLRKPTNDVGHLVAARMLYSAGFRAQACLEYSLATQYTSLAPSFVAEIAARYPAPSELVECLPTEANLLPHPIDILKSMGRVEAALLLARKTVTKHPDSAENLIRLGELELQSGQLADAEQALLAAENIKPSVRGALALAGVYARTQREEQAESILLQAEARSTSKWERVATLIDLARARELRGRPAEARQTLQRALGQASSDRALQARVHLELSRLERTMGNHHRATWEADRARDLSP